MFYYALEYFKKPICQEAYSYKDEAENIKCFLLKNLPFYYIYTYNIVSDQNIGWKDKQYDKFFLIFSS